MSVKVDVNELAIALTDFSFAYLVTVGEDYRAHTVAVDPGLADGVLDIGAVGRHTRANVTHHEAVTLIWPPRQPGGYTLIVDGQGRLSEDEHLKVAPGRAVLHRPAVQRDSAASESGCLHDCVPLEE